MTDPAPEPTRVAVFGDGSALGSAAAVAAMLDAVFPTPDARSRAAALLARRDQPATEETADSLLVALTEELLQEDAADPAVGEALAALGAHEAATRRNLRLYDPGARANPDAVWWPVPNHPKHPRRATDELPWAQRHPILDRTTPVGSAGSCFASEVAHRLQRDGFRYVVTQPNRNPTSGTHNACCRWGTIFNVASFRQLIERAYGAWTPPLLFGEHHDGGALQLSDPWLDAVTYVSVEEALSAQAALSEAARAAFDSVEVFVFTMGLAEVWRLKATGDVLARMPISMPRHLVEPAVLGFEENVAELERLWALWKRHNPKVKLILSVSPIPLNATFQGDEQHVIAATCEAKSILRAAAGAFARRHEDVYYLPSYDLVSYCVTHPWTEDGRHVTRRTVDRVMGLFDHLFVRPGGDAPLQLPRDCVVIDQRAGIDRDAVSVVFQVLRERGERPPVAVLLSPGADPAAAGEALAGLRHPGGLRLLAAPDGAEDWRRGLSAARLLVTARADAAVRGVVEQALLPTSAPTRVALAERLAELRVERQVAEVLQPLLHGPNAQLVVGLLADRQRALALGSGTARGQLILRRMNVSSQGQLSGALHQLVRRHLPFAGPLPATGVLGALDAADLQEPVRALARDGVMVWPTPLDSAVVERLVDFARRAPCRPLTRPGNHGPARAYPGADARYARYDFLESVLAEQLDAVQLALDPSLRALAGAYLGCDAVLDVLKLWWSAEERASDPSGATYQWDLPRAAAVRVLVLLTDVTPETGPLCVVRGSHARKPEPLFREGPASRDEVAAHYPADDHLELCGPAGTVIVLDPRAFHRTRPVATGERLALELQFSTEHFGEPYGRVLLPDAAPPELAARVRAHPRAYRHFEAPALR